MDLQNLRPEHKRLVGLDKEELADEISGEIDQLLNLLSLGTIKEEEYFKRKKEFMSLEKLITENGFSNPVPLGQEFTEPFETEEEKRGRGRPAGAKNKPKMSIEAPSTNGTSHREALSKVDAGTALNGLAMWIEQVAKSGVDEEKVRAIVAEAVAQIPSRTLEVKIADKITKLEGQQHYFFPLVMRCVAAGVNLALSGSTATSKTTMATQAAKVLDRAYFIQPMNDGTTKSDIMGYMSAVGEYIPSSFYRAMKEGGIYIAEEIDSGSPACLLVLNNAVDNRECTFPNGELVKAAEGFQVICTMNTKGTGADRKFVGRNRLDAATLDRFCMIEVKQDESLEASLLGIIQQQENIHLLTENRTAAKDWLDTVRDNRAKYLQSHPDKIVSMRATRDGWKLLQQGIPLSLVIKICIEK
jgi:MoxR-like ATPase